MNALILLYFPLRLISLQGRRTKTLATPLLHSEYIDSKIKRKICLKILKSIDGIVVSTPFEEALLKAWQIDGNKIFMIGEGVHPHKYYSPKVNEIISNVVRKKYITSPCPVILWIGRRFYGKGFHHLVLAMREVWEQLPNCKLVLIGDKVRDDKCPQETLLEVYKIFKTYKNNIIDIGVATEELKNAFLRISSIVVLPSKVETIPIVFLEAWACKKPVIGVEIPTIRSIIRYHGDGGILVKFGDVHQLAMAIIQMLSDAELYRKASEKGHVKVVSYYNWDLVVERLLNAYERVRGDCANRTRYKM